MIYALLLFGSIGLFFWSAYVFLVVWGWFIVPLGLPAITIPHAMGLQLFAGLLKMSLVPEADPSDHDPQAALNKLGKHTLALALALAFGALFHSFMP